MRMRLSNLRRLLTYRLRAGKRTGSILILALWSICLLATFAVVLSYGVRQKLTLVTRLDDRAKLSFMGDAAAKKAIIDLKIMAETTGESSDNSWNLGQSAIKERYIGDGKVQYALIDEARKININLARLSTLQDLFMLLLDFEETDAEKLAASIVDWRDEDSMLSIAFGSAEDRDYINSRLPYEAADNDYTVLDEILLVKGMTPDIFEILRDYLTIYGDGLVNINTAGKEVLQVLGMSEEIVEIVFLFRAGEDGLAGTIDDNTFSKHSSIIPRLSQFYHMSESQVSLMTQVVKKLRVDSDYFTVKGLNMLKKGKVTSDVNCIIDRTGAILYWHE